MTLVCREMKWTSEQYFEQPVWFIDYILELLKAESEATKRQLERSKRNN